MKHFNNLLRFPGIMFFLALFTFSSVLAQQAGFTYQAVARDNTGNPLENQDLTVRISIHETNADGALIWQEDHDVMTSEFGLFTLVVGGPDAYGTSGTAETFNDIDWSTTQYFMNVRVKKDNEFLDMGGSTIHTVPVAQFAQTANFAQTAQSAKSAAGKFAVQADSVGSNGEALFEVKRSDGSVAFAVYEDMVWVYAKESTKGVKGGFAVGGYNTAKADPDEYLRITPDSVRVYINEQSVKGKKGGFAVGGYNTANKGIGPQYFTVSGNNLIDNDYSITIGTDAQATGKFSTAIGYSSLASGYSSFAAGYSSQASSDNSIAIGNSTISSGKNATAMGYQSEASGERSIAIGSYYSHSIWLPLLDLNLKSADSKADFYPIYPINPIIPPIIFERTFNIPNTATGKYSIAIGHGNTATLGGMTFGSANSANGDGAVAIGLSNTALRRASFAGGYNSDATGYFATALGNNTVAQSYGSFVIGQFNTIAGDSTEWRSRDPLFVIGNGINTSNRNNAFQILKNGDTEFDGEYGYTLVNYRTSFRNPFTGVTSYTGYGIRSTVRRNDPDVGNYYSGWFSGSGSEGTYQGFYVDLRNGSSADVAEYIYDSNGNTEPGDVVIADPVVNQSVVLSSIAYQSSVVGVVSTDPHLVMAMELVIDEETGATKPNVQATRLALTGRVPCKVTDENGPIQPGDLLTTSSTPGHAMKWTPVDVNQAQDFDELKSMLAENESRRHAVIGKALEAHNGGTGKIMVLISLQ